MEILQVYMIQFFFQKSIFRTCHSLLESTNIRKMWKSSKEKQSQGKVEKSQWWKAEKNWMFQLSSFTENCRILKLFDFHEQFKLSAFWIKLTPFEKTGSIGW